MPFCDWKTFTTTTVDPAAWRAALASHDTMMARLAELQTQMVLASRPVQAQGKRLYDGVGFRPSGGAGDCTHVLELASAPQMR